MAIASAKDTVFRKNMPPDILIRIKQIFYISGAYLRSGNSYWRGAAEKTLIYTTNATQNFNRRLRKATKSKSVFPPDDALLKMLCLAMADITEKWTGRQDWGEIHSQLEIFFADRLE